MKSATIGNPGSQLHGLRTKCCSRTTRTGQAVYWALTASKPDTSWRERAFVLHVECMAAMVAAAPSVGAPVRPPELAAEIAALKAAAAAA